MRYCTKCLYPDTKPDIHFDKQGVCSACRNYENRPEVDWDARAKEFTDVIERHRSHPVYDCIVPVSGGKDSHYQVARVRHLGFNPLLVTATTCDLSPLGRKNLDNIRTVGGGCDHIEITPDPVLRRRLNRFGLEMVGDISWPEHVGIFTMPVRIAVQMGIKLIVWGENPQNEYGGPGAENSTLSRKWLEEFGGLLGLRVSDLPYDSRTLWQYTYPTDDELIASGVTGVFLGHYFPWDGYENAQIAQKLGFTFYKQWVEGSVCEYENLDNCHTGTHDWFKFLKFGFGRATDIACNHIRRGRWTRGRALDMIRGYDGAFPDVYLGKRLDDILGEMDMTRDEFMDIAKRFRNRRILDEKFNLKEPPC